MENFSRKIQAFNNSVGYASKEVGNNLIVKEQWLESPSWTIYILEDSSEEYKKIKEYLINKKCEYIPYIGKNDHFADIKNVEIQETKELEENVNKLDSLYEENIAEEVDNLFDEILGFEEVDNLFDEILGFEIKKDKRYFYKELLPIELNEKIGYSKFSNFIYTNKEINIIDKTNIHKVGNKNIYYF